jgi:hypothetical protein
MFRQPRFLALAERLLASTVGLQPSQQRPPKRALEEAGGGRDDQVRMGSTPKILLRKSLSRGG